MKIQKRLIEFPKTSGILIPSKYQKEDFYQNIKNDLTRLSVDWQDPSLKIKQEYFYEAEDYLLIPRNFPIKDFCDEIEIKNMLPKGKDIEINHNIIPRSEVQKTSIDYMLKNENCILQLDPGVGKTVIAIYVISMLKKRSLIIAHRDSLVEQWMNRILEFTDCKKEDIMRLTSNNYKEGINKKIMVTTVQTILSLLRRDKEEFIKSLIEMKLGILIADEIHISVGAYEFSKCSLWIPSYRSYGLSATPYRYDGNTDIIKYHLGETFQGEDLENTINPTVNILLLDYNIYTEKRVRYLMWGGQFQRSRYLNLMKKSVQFLSLSKTLIDKLKEKRKIIFVAERIKLLDFMYEIIEGDKGKFYGPGGLENMDNKITFATPGKVRDGIDKPEKDCLIMTSPIKNINQISGRISRTFKDKMNAEIYDIVDIGCRFIYQTLFQRIKYYESKKWDINFIVCFQDGKTEKVTKNDAIKILGRK